MNENPNFLINVDTKTHKEVEVVEAVPLRESSEKP